MLHASSARHMPSEKSFNGHPPLGVNATQNRRRHGWKGFSVEFQWVPTLGGECYKAELFMLRRYERAVGFNGHPPLGVNATEDPCHHYETHSEFQWAPTLGGECYWDVVGPQAVTPEFQWAPTLGGECYAEFVSARAIDAIEFQWAPTLGGECYEVTGCVKRSSKSRFNGHPPLGVNATIRHRRRCP